MYQTTLAALAQQAERLADFTNGEPISVTVDMHPGGHAYRVTVHVRMHDGREFHDIYTYSPSGILKWHSLEPVAA